MTQLTVGYWQGTFWVGGYWQSNYWQRYAAGTLFDNLITWVEKQPSENPWRTGTWVPGMWDECRLLTSIIKKFEE
jgi:hypothetical protein